MNGGKGLEGVSSKGRNYYNPFVEIMKNGSRAAAKKMIFRCCKYDQTPYFNYISILIL